MTTRTERSEVEAAFQNAGLPHAMYAKKERTPSEDRNSWDVQIGVLAHAAIGKVARLAQDVAVDDQVRLARRAVSDVLKGRQRLGRHDKAAMRIVGMVSTYLRNYLPGSPHVFLGAELSAGTGRVDLAWSSPTVGVFYDELKTWRHHTPTLDRSTHDQVSRYLDAGLSQYGAGFAGVRLLTLGNSTGCLAVTPEGTLEPLWNSSLSPDNLGRVEGVAS